MKISKAPVKSRRTPQVGQPAGHRHRQDVHEQVAVDDPARLAQLDPAGARGGIREVGQDRRERDGRDHQLQPGQEDADPDDGEQHERRAAGHAPECSGRQVRGRVRLLRWAARGGGGGGRGGRPTTWHAWPTAIAPGEGTGLHIGEVVGGRVMSGVTMSRIFDLALRLGWGRGRCPTRRPSPQPAPSGAGVARDHQPVHRDPNGLDRCVECVAHGPRGPVRLLPRHPAHGGVVAHRPLEARPGDGGRAHPRHRLRPRRRRPDRRPQAERRRHPDRPGRSLDARWDGVYGVAWPQMFAEQHIPVTWMMGGGADYTSGIHRWRSCCTRRRSPSSASRPSRRSSRR